ncbi:hypothetical protein DNTS_018386 [Danionella cerebrum]|uniref:Uncharacterized protein n=1 Tax=Danionella cerebrum TaxID=2873325 RepID=A0A553NK04_9TELE|nr:hypothetical protein DNTS_018386 [Danionella translucida]
MSDDISLNELLDLSIGTPDAGSVNFGALYALLRALLGHLKLERLTTSWTAADGELEDGSGHGRAPLVLADSASTFRAMEEKVRRMEEQMCALEALPSAAELLGSDTALSDMWSLMQLRRKAQGNEDGVSKDHAHLVRCSVAVTHGNSWVCMWYIDGHSALTLQPSRTPDNVSVCVCDDKPVQSHLQCMALIQDLLKEIQTLKESRDGLRQEVNVLNGQISQLNMDEISERIKAMEQYCNQVEDLDNTTKELKAKLAQYPGPEELTQCVTWEVMQAALISERPKIQEDLRETLGTASNNKPVQTLNCGSPGTEAGFEGTVDEDLSRQVSQLHPSDGCLNAVTGRRLSRVSIGAEHYPETVEALTEVGKLRDKHESLDTRVTFLEANKADQSQLQHLHAVLTALEEKRIPDYVPEQLNNLKTLVDRLLEDKKEVSEVESVLMEMRADLVCEGSDRDLPRDDSQIQQLNQQTAQIR